MRGSRHARQREPAREAAETGRWTWTCIVGNEYMLGAFVKPLQNVANRAKDYAIDEKQENAVALESA